MKIYCQALTSPISLQNCKTAKLQNRSFHVAGRTRTIAKCAKGINTRAKPGHCQICSCCRDRRGCSSSLITPLLPLMVAKVLWDDDHDYNTVQLDKSRVSVGVS